MSLLPSGLRLAAAAFVVLVAFPAVAADRPNRTASPVARPPAEAEEAAAPAPEAGAEERWSLRRTIDWIIPDTWPRLFPRRSSEGERAEAQTEAAPAATEPAEAERTRTRVTRTDPSARRNRTASASQRPQMERVERTSVFRSESSEADTRPLWNRLTGWIPMPDTWSRPVDRPAPTASTPAAPRAERSAPQAYGAARTSPPARAQASPPSSTAPAPPPAVRPPDRRAPRTGEIPLAALARAARLWVSPFMMRSVTPDHAGLGPALTGAFRERWAGAGRLADRSADAAYRLEGQYSVDGGGTAAVTAYLRGARGLVRSFRWEAPAASAAGLSDRMIAEVEAAIPAE